MKELKLPQPPVVLARAIKVAADPDCTVTSLAEVVKRSPVLSAQLLKAVNSPYYALRRKVSAIDRAISFMGIRAVRNTLLCFGVRELEPPNSKYPLETFWECSLQRATAAVCLAKKLGTADVDNILTLGLCQDLGILVITQDEKIGEELALAIRFPADQRLDIEKRHDVSHIELGAKMFEQWTFPEDIIEAVRFHHDPEEAPEEYRTLSKISCTAETIADLMGVDDKKACLIMANQALDDIGIGSDSLSEILSEVSEEVTKAAEMLQIEVGEQPDYQEIMQAASQGLFALNMSYQSLTEELQDSLKQQEKMAKRLELLNAELEKQAMTDKLTGLPNRRAFDETLEKEISRSKRITENCSLIIMDIDHFKKFNDVHGHQIGDLVLENVGAAIRSAVRKCDLPARYGGEEFAVVLPHTQMEGAIIAAERLRVAIEKMNVKTPDKILKVTVSLGVTVIKDPDVGRAGTLAIRRADDALYEAKADGRNCVKSLE